MSDLNILEISCRFDYQAVSEAELLSMLVAWTEQSAGEEKWVYAMFVNEVVIGAWRNGKLLLGHTRPCRVQALDQDQVRYLQEIRVFNRRQELRAIRMENRFSIRVLEDEGSDSVSGQPKFSCLSETHKLWGHSKGRQTSDKESDWTLLSSERGTQLYFPDSLPKGAEKGLIVRNYIEFEDQKRIGMDEVWKPRSGYRFVDERMVGFVDWSSQEGERVERSL
ncbi:type III-D CRISPR-associated protein Csx19 [Saccharibacillus alkalitolerans]|uniref:CRISPR-associated protein n=1 Tax=Saccharibacillus alkalitolerans TaxID=2705290 RepID=A0ABX0F0J5_9BACL|nr:CRISPR-associated protein Csx19 [Saccharibacillus alkalitolerans]NGZ74060.1 hypothetical protein [Saccharibacillus alkalitolerans]